MSLEKLKQFMERCRAGKGRGPREFRTIARISMRRLENLGDF
jgi:hypothetical protein